MNILYFTPKFAGCSNERYPPVFMNWRFFLLVAGTSLNELKNEYLPQGNLSLLPSLQTKHGVQYEHTHLIFLNIWIVCMLQFAFQEIWARNVNFSPTLTTNPQHRNSQPMTPPHNHLALQRHWVTSWALPLTPQGSYSWNLYSIMHGKEEYIHTSSDKLNGS